MEYHDPLNAGLVFPFQCPRDGRSTLPVLPSLPQLSLLRATADEVIECPFAMRQLME
jgi:hypothetical protein